MAAIPVAFLASALVGAVLERGVIRFLYGRPLETLLATWGISLMLQQLVRSLFGAQNVGVENPSWMSGGCHDAGNVTLPWNRICIIIFAVPGAAGDGLADRPHAAGPLRARRHAEPADRLLHGREHRAHRHLRLRARLGHRGPGGLRASQIGNVGPDLGQSYIVDSFMVVVMGGVGQLAGTVYAALGLGVLNKFIEGWAGAVLAKIAVLVFIIIFIQKRPQGIFAMKGRSAEA